MAFGKRKSIQIFCIAEDTIVPMKEIPLPEPPLLMVRNFQQHGSGGDFPRK